MEDSNNYKAVSKAINKIKAIDIADPYFALLYKDV
jgi:hypothetical protein